MTLVLLAVFSSAVAANDTVAADVADVIAGVVDVVVAVVYQFTCND